MGFFIKLQTDALLNPKVRRLSNEAFRVWIYLLSQAWKEGPGKPAGTIQFKGVLEADRERAFRRVSSWCADAAGADDGQVDTRTCLNELVNVGLVHTSVDGDAEVGTEVGTSGTSPNSARDTWWDITVQMHDWSDHNPRAAPSHTPEGEAARKAKYREGKKKAAQESQGERPNGPKLVVPSVPTLDKDQDADKDQDPDSQTDGRLTSLRHALARQFGFEKPLGLGRDQERTRKEFTRWFDARGPEATGIECLRLAAEKGEKPRHLSWFVGWLETVPNQDLFREAL